jgi:uncharacterized protein (DUF2141 family)
MKKTFFIAATYLVGAAASAQNTATGTLSFSASGFDNNGGKAAILLFRKGDTIPTKPYKILSVPISNKAAAISFPGLAYGEYAAILLHDADSDGKITHAFGLPSEQLGYTNNWKLGFFTGMPTFSKLKFLFSPSATTQEIHITYKKK